MAGVGFELRKMLVKDAYISAFKAYLYAAFVSSGPWLISSICLVVLGIYRGTGFGRVEHEIFRSTVLYTFAFSLIYIGFIQLVCARYLADQSYEKGHIYTLRTFFTATALVLAGAAPFSIVGYWTFAFEPLYKATAIILFMIISMIWLALVFLASVKDYAAITMAFLVGAVASVGGAMFLGSKLGLDGFLIGFTLGQALIFFGLLARLLALFPASTIWDKGLVSAFKRHWDLCLIGAIYNLAIWIDKFIFWFAPDARLLTPWLRTHDFYEAPIFFSYLTILPTLVIFMLKIETKFYVHYRNYYANVVEKKSYTSILAEKGLLVKMLKEQIRGLFIVQGSITGLCIVFAPQIVDVIKLSAAQVPLMRVALLGAFLQILLLLSIIVLFNFDLRKRVLAIAVFFLLTNAGLTWLSLGMGVPFYGYGYGCACLLSALLALKLLAHALENLEFITFAKHPVG